MLNWVHETQGWTANGFVIRLLGPSRFALCERGEPQPGAVRVVPEPLTVEGTLTSAKREAELLNATRLRAAHTRRAVVRGIASLAALAIALDMAAPWNALLAFGLVLVAARSAVTILESRFGRFGGSPEDFFYQ